MKQHLVALALAAALAGGGAMSAQAGGAKFGASAKSPGHQMHAKGSVKGHPGASGYAPGHLKANAHVRARTHVRHNRSTVGAGVRID
jgi:hypothetical protein